MLAEVYPDWSDDEVDEVFSLVFDAVQNATKHREGDGMIARLQTPHQAKATFSVSFCSELRQPYLGKGVRLTIDPNLNPGQGDFAPSPIVEAIQRCPTARMALKSRASL